MLLSLLFFLLVFPSYGLSPYELSLLQELKTLDKTPPEEYLATADIYRKKLTQYINNKKRVCNGEFSTMVFTDPPLQKNPSPPPERKKLSPKQKQSCLRELNSLHRKFIRHMFIARKNYLVFIQNKQLEELEKVRRSSLKDLQVSPPKN